MLITVRGGLLRGMPVVEFDVEFRRISVSVRKILSSRRVAELDVQTFENIDVLVATLKDRVLALVG